MKTPILRPPVEAVLFGFERIGLVVRLAWLPIVLCFLLYAGAFVQFGGGDFAVLASAASEAPAPGDSGARLGDLADRLAAMRDGPGAGFMILQSTLLPLLAGLILSCVYVAVTRASTRADYAPPRLPFYFALGGRELRYFAVRILYAIVAILSGVVFVMGIAAAIAFGVGAATPLEGSAKALAIAPAAAVAIALLAVWIGILVRLLPVFAIAAVENRIAFGDAWRMTKGQTLRLLASGVFFIAVLQATVIAFALIIFLPAIVALGLLAAIGYGVLGAASFVVFALLALVAIPAFIAIAAFSVAAEAAFPARLYAYLSECGEQCKIA
jgi:hypothetical protein